MKLSRLNISASASKTLGSSSRPWLRWSRTRCQWPVGKSSSLVNFISVQSDASESFSSCISSTRSPQEAAYLSKVSTAPCRRVSSVSVASHAMPSQATTWARVSFGRASVTSAVFGWHRTDIEYSAWKTASATSVIPLSSLPPRSSRSMWAARLEGPGQTKFNTTASSAGGRTPPRNSPSLRPSQSGVLPRTSRGRPYPWLYDGSALDSTRCFKAPTVSRVGVDTRPTSAPPRVRTSTRTTPSVAAASSVVWGGTSSVQAADQTADGDGSPRQSPGDSIVIPPM
mmetsp:Transcript_81348/g.242443  ORF Transcript_81348/g.242443 Transcript_81348/m.242443 type:complete len:284 (-) Transcript_81348:37-888(-)